MAYYLTIDQGNTVAKLALWDDTREIDYLVDEGLTAERIETFVDGREIRSALYCSVASEMPAIIDELHSITRDVKRLTARMPLPILVEYGSPCSLGADRIAAAVGALATFPGEQVLVVDIGTAVTYDVVTADRRFVGGNIAPGLKMRLDSLHRYTARLPQLEVPEEVSGDEPVLGHDTASAMIRGALYGVAGAITYYHSRLDPGTRVLLTGGDARVIRPLCNIPITVDDHLVNKGLNRILLYNEDK